MSFGVIVGILLVICLIIGVGILSGNKVQNAKDFLSGGGQANSLLVCGAILGSLVSSQATIGTAQLAFHYGLAAWWFTLGSGIGCLFLALGYTRRLRRSQCITELQIIEKEYGFLAGSLGSVLCSLGIFISVLAQVVASVGLLTVLFPEIPLLAAAAVSIILMCVYVIFGGAWGAGMGGIVKLLLLCVTSVLGLAFVLISCRGVDGLLGEIGALLVGTDLGKIQGAANGLSEIASYSDLSHRFVNLVARGTAKDIGSGLSLLLGVLSTQTYAQAIWSAKSTRAAQRGALLSAFLIPPIGIGGICIGLFMRSKYLLAAEAAALSAAGMAVPDMPVLESTIQVFPAFVLDCLPPVVAGIVLGTLLITVVGGGAGLSLGMATILVKDILKKLTKKLDSPEKELAAVRGCIAVILFAAACVTISVSSSAINDLGFLSMGLRGAVVFLPLTCALWLPGKIDKSGILASMVFATCSIFIADLIGLPVDSLFVGVAVSALFCVLGHVKRKLTTSEISK